MLKDPNYTILIVESDLHFRNEILTKLKENFQNVRYLTAENCSEGILKISTQKIHLVISEVKKTDRAGTTLLDKIKNLHIDLKPEKFIAIYKSMVDVENYSDSMQVEFFSTPLRWEDFIFSVENAIVEIIENRKNFYFNISNKKNSNIFYVNTFKNSTLSSFKNYFLIYPEQKRIFSRKTLISSLNDITLATTIANESYDGIFALTFSNKLSAHLFSIDQNQSLFNRANDEKDVLFKLCNAIYEKSVKALQLYSTPSNPLTPNFKVIHPNTSVSLNMKHFYVVEFFTTKGDFFLQVTLVEK